MSRAAVVLLMLVVSGCRTKLWDAGQVERDDLAAADAGWDLGLDFSTVWDFARPPDLVNADLVLPFACTRIWVVDANGMFSSFDTERRTFKDVKKLDCPSVSSPQTMAVDKNGLAWVLYSDGNLFNVDVTTGDCRPTAFDPNQLLTNGGNSVTAGSCFSADTITNSSETYYLHSSTAGKLYKVDVKTLKLVPIVDTAEIGELTGTGDAELWSLALVNNEWRVARIDKRTAVADVVFPVPQITGGGGYAFAFWGGSFWIFHGGAKGTDVFRVDRATGMVETVLTGTGRGILGAGVSSCAPVGLDQ